MEKIIRWIGLSAVMSLMFACLGSPTGGGGSGTGSEIITYSYTLRGDSLTINLPPTVFSYCIGNNLSRDTFDFGSITVYVEVLADSLKLFDSDTTMLSSGAVVQYATVFCRSTGGGGILGTWTPCAATYRVMAGSVLTANDQVEIANELSRKTNDMRDEPGTLVFSQTEITITVDRNRAQDFVDEWNDFNAGNYDINLIVVSRNIVELRGGASSEIVRITFSSNGDRVYSSNDTSHATYRVYENPTQCPNPQGEDWFPNFLDANILTPGARPLPKVSARHRFPRIF